MQRLVIQKNRYTIGWSSTNLELQLRYWGFKAHGDWAVKHNFAGAIVDKKTGKMLEYRDLLKRPELCETWIISLSSELGRIAQGISQEKGTNTICLINK